VLLGDLAGRLVELKGLELEALVLEAGDDVANKAALRAMGEVGCPGAVSQSRRGEVPGRSFRGIIADRDIHKRFYALFYAGSARRTSRKGVQTSMGEGSTGGRR